MAVHPQIELVAASSRGEEHLHWFGQHWDVSALYLDYQTMLAREQLDIVCIATHPGLHLSIVKLLSRQGLKAFLRKAASPFPN